MGGLNGKCGDEVEMMIVKNIPSSVFPSLVFFFNDRIFKHFVNLNTSQGNYYSVEQMT